MSPMILDDGEEEEEDGDLVLVLIVDCDVLDTWLSTWLLNNVVDVDGSKWDMLILLFEWTMFDDGDGNDPLTAAAAAAE